MTPTSGSPPGCLHFSKSPPQQRMKVASSGLTLFFSVRSGFAHPLGIVDGGNKHEFSSPSYGPDWVLVLDAATRNYPRRVQA